MPIPERFLTPSPAVERFSGNFLFLRAWIETVMRFEQYTPVQLPNNAESHFRAVEDNRTRLGIGSASHSEQKSLGVAAQIRNKLMRTPQRGGQSERSKRGNKSGQTGNTH